MKQCDAKERNRNKLSFDFMTNIRFEHSNYPRFIYLSLFFSSVCFFLLLFI